MYTGYYYLHNTPPNSLYPPYHHGNVYPYYNYHGNHKVGKHLRSINNSNSNGNNKHHGNSNGDSNKRSSTKNVFGSASFTHHSSISSSHPTRHRNSPKQLLDNKSVGTPSSMTSSTISGIVSASSSSSSPSSTFSSSPPPLQPIASQQGKNDRQGYHHLGQTNEKANRPNPHRQQDNQTTNVHSPHQEYSSLKPNGTTSHATHHLSVDPIRATSMTPLAKGSSTHSDSLSPRNTTISPSSTNGSSGLHHQKDVKTKLKSNWGKKRKTQAPVPSNSIEASGMYELEQWKTQLTFFIWLRTPWPYFRCLLPALTPPRRTVIQNPTTGRGTTAISSRHCQKGTVYHDRSTPTRLNQQHECFAATARSLPSFVPSPTLRDPVDAL